MTSRPNSLTKRRTLGKFQPALLTALVSLSVGFSAVGAHSITPKVFIGEHQLSFSAAPFLIGDGVLYAPVDAVKSLGAVYQVAQDNNSVAVTIGVRTSVFPCQQRDRQVMAPIALIAQDLGAQYQWDQASQTATILAKIRMVREDSDHLSVSTSFPTGYHVDSAANPSRIYIDVYGASLGAPETTVPVSGDDVAAVRANQMTPTTVRVVVDLKTTMTYHVASPAGTNRVDVSMLPFDGNAPSGMTPVSTADEADGRGTSDDNGGSDDSAPAPPVAGVDLHRSNASQHIKDIAYDASKPGLLQVNVIVDGSGNGSQPYKAFMLDNPARLAIDLPGADFDLSGDLAANTACTMPMVNAMVKSLRWGVLHGTGNVVSRVVLDMYRPLSYAVSTTPLPGGETEYTVNVLIAGGSQSILRGASGPSPIVVAPNPNVAAAPVQPAIQPEITPPAPDAPDSVLIGKTIVVDPGHGGKDTGAPGVDGLYEKNIVLSIGKLVRDQLSACGARVVMTRADDTFIPLAERAQMGVDNHADLFVSIHADSAGSRNSYNGTTVYYHANLRKCHAMASAIAERLGQLNDGIHALGVRSDYVRFPGVGFSVLRNSPEPAVLVETGYVNSDHDAGILNDPAMQQLIASGIVAGIKDYVYRAAGPEARAIPASAPEGDGDSALTLTHE